jgi:hypothetical protein
MIIERSFLTMLRLTTLSQLLLRVKPTSGEVKKGDFPLHTVLKKENARSGKMEAMCAL